MSLTANPLTVKTQEDRQDGKLRKPDPHPCPCTCSRPRRRTQPRTFLMIFSLNRSFFEPLWKLHRLGGLRLDDQESSISQANMKIANIFLPARASRWAMYPAAINQASSRRSNRVPLALFALLMELFIYVLPRQATEVARLVCTVSAALVLVQRKRLGWLMAHQLAPTHRSMLELVRTRTNQPFDRAHPSSRNGS